MRIYTELQTVCVTIQPHRSAVDRKELLGENVLKDYGKIENGALMDGGCDDKLRNPPGD